MYVSQIDDFIKRMKDIQVGAVAPDFTLPDVDGKMCIRDSVYVKDKFNLGVQDYFEKQNPAALEEDVYKRQLREYGSKYKATIGIMDYLCRGNNRSK